jgi:sensor domain CHASE-containing protein
VFIQGPQGKNVFWGFVVAVIHIDELLSNAGGMDLERKGINYKVCKLPTEAEPQSGACAESGGAVNGAMVDPLLVTIGLPNTQWQLFVAPESGWVSPGEWLAVVLAVISGTLLAGLASFTRLRRAAKIGSDPSLSVSPE